MRTFFCGFFFGLFSIGTATSQVINTTMMDTLETTTIGQVGLGGYVDSYYGYNTSEPSTGSNPYFVSSARHNNVMINLAYIDVRYRSSYMRVRFVPGFGSYMDDNYASEPGSLKNMVEANVGVLIFPAKKIWVDVGVLGSPYTSESLVSKDQLMYTRSLASEQSPYYLAGAKLTLPISEKVNAYLFLMNGWQVIQDNNSSKSLGTQVEYRPNKQMLFNWSTYAGDERSTTNPDYRMRYFSDFYWIFKSGSRWSATSSFYIGAQERATASSATWWQANVIAKYAFSKKFSLSARVEHFRDPSSIIVSSITSMPGFRTTGYGLCGNIQLHKSAVFRLEARQFISQEDQYIDKSANPSRQSTLLIANLTAWF